MTTRRGFLGALAGTVAALKLGVKLDARPPRVRMGCNPLRGLMDDGTCYDTIRTLEGELRRVYQRDPAFMPFQRDARFWDIK